jgi:hypothetical protein
MRTGKDVHSPGAAREGVLRSGNRHARCYPFASHFVTRYGWMRCAHSGRPGRSPAASRVGPRRLMLLPQEDGPFVGSRDELEADRLRRRSEKRHRTIEKPPRARRGLLSHVQSWALWTSIDPRERSTLVRRSTIPLLNHVIRGSGRCPFRSAGSARDRNSAPNVQASRCPAPGLRRACGVWRRVQSGVHAKRVERDSSVGARVSGD